MNAIVIPPLRRLLRPITSKVSEDALRAMANFQADPEDEDRYHDLADRNAEGTITVEEKRELDEIIDAIYLLSQLRDEARSVLAARAA